MAELSPSSAIDFLELGKAGLDEVSQIRTSIPLHQRLLSEPDILNGDYSIKWLEDWLAREAAENG